MMFSRKYLILLFSLIFISLLAQNSITPDRLSIQDGLSQGFIPAMAQDQEGFLWFGTKNGLNRYDGENFEVYTRNPTNPFSISDDRVTNIVALQEFLFVGTEGGGLQIFHKPSKKFFRISNENPSEVDWATMEIKDIFVDALGHLWVVGSEAGRLLKIRFPEQYWQQFTSNNQSIDPLEIIEIENINVSKILKEEDEQIYILDVKKIIYKIDILSSEIAELSNQLKDGEQYDFNLQPKVGFLAYSSNDNQKISYYNNDKWSYINTDFSMHSIFYLDDEKQLWINSEQEILLFDNWEPTDNQLLRNEADFKISINQKNESCLSLLQDEAGILWFSTNGYGLIKVNPRLLLIKKYFNDHSIYATPFMLRDKSIVVSSLESSLLTSRELSRFSYDHLGAWWFYDHNDKIWMVGKLEDAVEIVHMEDDGQLLHKDTISVNSHSKYFHASYMDEKEYLLWTAIQDGTFVRYNMEERSWKTYYFDHLFQNNFSCHSIAPGADGKWWIGTSRGLVQASPTDTGFVFTLAPLQTDSSNGLLNAEVSSLLPDPIESNILWIATKGGGLHKMDTRTMNFKYLNTKSSIVSGGSKLPDDVIYGILSDGFGNLWMSSNKGIIRYQTQTGKVTNFNQADGLQNDEFNTWAYAKALTGEFMFGGVDGLNVFDPDDFKDRSEVPNTFITSLYVNNQLVEIADSTDLLHHSIEYTTEITLPFSKNNVSLEFASLDYSTPFKNRYRYYLEGAEEEWAHENTDNKATYLKLPPGYYTFHVNGSNGDGHWAKEAQKLTIKILPPWYRTNLAWLLYALLAGLLIWRISKYERNRIRLKIAADLEHKEAERLKELDDIKTKLYTNITHEFRTPLTVISGMADELKGGAKQKELIKRNTDQLLNLVNQMLDLRKIEAGAITFENKQQDIIKFLRYLLESMKSYISAEGLTVHFLAEQKELIMDFDAEKLTRIFMNLMSNAVKFTPEGGNIYVQVESIDQLFILKVKDTGEGIAKEELPHIFKQFYQANRYSTHSSSGTGIGLTLVSELVRAMDGQIKVESSIGEGSTFTVMLPITRNAEIQNMDFYAEHSSMMISEIASKERPYDLIEDVGSPADRPTALVVEDNADVIHYLIACLKDHYQIQIAMNGEEGIHHAIEKSPDIIISDVMMPVKDGFEMCDTLKNDERTSHIPIVFLTAKADVSSRLSGLKLGADAYLSKPFLKDELLIILRQQIELRKRLHEHFSILGIKEAGSLSELELDLAVEDAFLQKIKALVEERINDVDFGMPQLIRGLRMSRSQIYKKVKALTGISPSRYVRSIRLHKARTLLQTTELNVSEIAYDVGFSSPAYFSDMYLEEFGKRPIDEKI